ncbi:PREDICTED: probable cytochrome P450 6a14 [Habropoda laboriosa]|uniref:probable cytochrome P450 6a14 n=1 Tax=Habropoda laboriosa TaxID=597456 RepID=UPI00083E4688|nr:PREDICTED: probable cytochrome P450 6a14 [Habropoda laboriosa]
MTGVEILCGLTVLLLLFYYYMVRPYEVWKKIGLPGPTPSLIFGNFYPVLIGKTSIGDQMTKFYKQFKHLPIFGLYIRGHHVLAVNDPNVIKTVLIKDFSKFADRGIALNEVAEPLSQHLFALEPKRWRPLRTRLTPLFTSGKIKDMLALILESSKTLEKYLETLVEKETSVEVREIAAKFTTDVIGSCAFGIDMNAISNEQCQFREIGREFFGPGWKQGLRLRMREAFPRLYTLLGYLLPEDQMTTFFTKVVMDMIEYRKENNVVRPDFINTLMDIQAHPEKINIELTKHLLVAQAFVFFVAGFETSASTISNALYELAQNQDTQDKLRNEIREHYKRNEGEWKYENIKDMPCLDAVFKETLRKYPPVTVIMRKNSEPYTFEDVNITIPKNTRIFIPVYGIHRDPEIYPNPDVFDIDRFKEDAVATRHPMHYLPFGDGPRNCIGARFAIFQTKIGLIKILRNYKLDVCEQTQIPFINEPRTFTLAPKHGLILKITKTGS